MHSFRCLLIVMCSKLKQRLLSKFNTTTLLIETSYSNSFSLLIVEQYSFFHKLLIYLQAINRTLIIKLKSLRWNQGRKIGHTGSILKTLPRIINLCWSYLRNLLCESHRAGKSISLTHSSILQSPYQKSPIKLCKHTHSAMSFRLRPFGPVFGVGKKSSKSFVVLEVFRIWTKWNSDFNELS